MTTTTSTPKLENCLWLNGKIWQFRRTVPARFCAVEDRTEITKSMRTDSRSCAEDKAKAYWDGLEAGWEARLVGKDDHAAELFACAQKIVKSKGLRYIPIKELSVAPLEGLLTRIEAMEVLKGVPNREQGAALLGVIPKPSVTVSEALELNPEARAIFTVMINTGARPSEIANLVTDRIVLAGNTPHIQIRPDGRKLKSDRAERDVPLTGVSLEAMRAFPNGFPKYRESSSTLSATVNKYLRANGLVESEKHTMYSLRHALMNRMIVNKVDDRVRRDIMGHNLSGVEYGDGGGVEHRAVVMSAFAI